MRIKYFVLTLFTLFLTITTSCSISQPTPTKSPKPTLIPLIDTSISVEGIEISLFNADLNPIQIQSNSPDADILLISINTPSEEEAKTIANSWPVTVTDENNQVYKPNVVSIFTDPDDPDALVEWPFSIDKNAQSLILHLPEGNDIPLNSVLDD